MELNLIKGVIIKVFENIKLLITIQANEKVDLLDVNLDVTTGPFKPFKSRMKLQSM